MSTTESPKVSFAGNIPQELYDRFQALLPMYGAATWVINNLLTNFVEQLEANPSLRDSIEESVKATVYFNSRMNR